MVGEWIRGKMWVGKSHGKGLVTLVVGAVTRRAGWRSGSRKNVGGKVAGSPGWVPVVPESKRFVLRTQRK